MADFYFGLDLGQTKDYTALVIIEKTADPKPGLLVRHLERYPLGTSCPAIVESIALRLRHETFRKAQPILAMDATGCGASVADMFRDAKLWACLRPVIITGGDSVTRDGTVTRVPKRDLVGVVQVGLQTGRLKIAPALKDASLLERELLNFQVKISESAHDSYGAWREGQHDDLVLALAAYAAMEWRTPRNPAVGPPRSHTSVSWG